MPSPPPPRLQRILIVEDDPPGQRRLDALSRAVFGTGPEVVVVASVAAAKVAADAAGFDLALVDIGLPDGSGVDLIAWLQGRDVETACVVITAWGDGDTVLAALRAGAVGYLLKDRDDAELTRALQNIQRGGAPIDPFVARRILAALPGAAAQAAAERGGANDLTAREHEVLGLVAHGHNNREIAALTGLSRFTIEDYTKRIYRKLAVGSRAAAVFEAQARGLLKP